ncbi:hypothetical protein H8B15_02025 [Hymenobacter sp. BT507]|uniref:Apea-like HEPN domain-containing protein n=1 Tax=Hymenobacter citatus TaxID=2763506 RepID=A0ABR7MF49_9BACT|nr:hypothetical protein [Hymenobacter citatus]MBC6609681.1 hypothetical protein [Hymenobacter citatus]
MKSPLFISSIELLAHATELFGSKNPKKYKFIILHLTNSIELMLKDRLLSCGHSIYSPKNQNLTLTIWDTFTSLDGKGISIPEKPIIELLVDDRNTIQHRFGFPNEESVFYYLSATKDFLQRFLKDEYNVDLAEELKPHLKNDYLELIGLSDSETTNLNKLKEVSPEMAILQISSDIERETREILEPYKESKEASDQEFRNKYFYKFWNKAEPIISALMISKHVSHGRYEELADKYKIFSQLRVEISHGSLNNKEITKERIQEIFNDGLEIFNIIKEAKEKSVFSTEILDKAFAL